MYASCRGLPLIHTIKCLVYCTVSSITTYNIKSLIGQLHVYQAPQSEIEHILAISSIYMLFHHHLLLKTTTDTKISIQAKCTHHQKLSYHSNFYMRLEFLFNVLQLWPSSTPSFTEKGKDNSPASGTGKTDLLCSLFSFQFSIEVNNWKAQPAFSGSEESNIASLQLCFTDQQTVWWNLQRIMLVLQNYWSLEFLLIWITSLFTMLNMYK